MLLTTATSLCYESLLTLVYPQSCAVCGGSVESRVLGAACENCWQRTSLFFADQVLCWKCGAPSAGLVSPDEPEAVSCHRCDPDAFTAARACGAYEGALRASVLLLKHQPQICPRLLDNLVRISKTTPLDRATLIVPVPLHPEREHARGFNQAALISRELSRAVSLPVNELSLVRSKHVKHHRAGMDAKGRRDTVANAFQVVRPTLLNGERVLLVDDVFTTGATVSACAELLRSAGATEVYVLTIARAVHF
ncbi:MAG TPA: ComF family protein [Pyrinomonadaceae bacterium]|nr:ComF family protein [Pyrinomonadaceae bacterium]